MSLSARFFAALGFFAIYVFAQPAFAQTNTIAVISADQLGTPSHSNLRLSLPELWQRTMVSHVDLPDDQAIDPEEIWGWEQRRFSHKESPSRTRFHAGERCVARFSITTQEYRLLVLEVSEPRLDDVHFSIRKPGEPWRTSSSGDRIAMNKWQSPDRHPSFLFDTPAGRVDVVLQIAHRGIVGEHAFLSEKNHYLTARVKAAWLNGFLVSMCFLMAFVGVLGFVNHSNDAFLSVTLLMVSMGVVLFFTSGEGGTFFFLDEPYFNDRSKLFATMLLMLSIPMAFSVALGLHKYKGYPLSSLDGKIQGCVKLQQNP